MSRYKFDRSREFIPGYKVGGGHLRSVAVQTVSEPEICHGAGFKLRTDERARVQRALQICLECRNKSKKCDKQLTHIVRVISRVLFLFFDVSLFYFWAEVYSQSYVYVIGRNVNIRV